MTGKEPRLWSCPPAAATESYIWDTIGLLEPPLASPPGGPEEKYYWALGYGRDVNGMGTRDWYLMHYSGPSVTGGQKHTHISFCHPHRYPAALLSHCRPSLPRTGQSALLNRPIGSGKRAVFFFSFDHLMIFHKEMTHNNETHQNTLIIPPPPTVEFMNISPSTLKACGSTHPLPATSNPSWWGLPSSCRDIWWLSPFVPCTLDVP